jgi:hypothetical protein
MEFSVEDSLREKFEEEIKTLLASGQLSRYKELYEKQKSQTKAYKPIVDDEVEFPPGFSSSEEN